MLIFFFFSTENLPRCGSLGAKDCEKPRRKQSKINNRRFRIETAEG